MSALFAVLTAVMRMLAVVGIPVGVLIIAGEVRELVGGLRS